MVELPLKEDLAGDNATQGLFKNAIGKVHDVLLNMYQKEDVDKQITAINDVISVGQDWAGVDYVDTAAIGANPIAKIYPDKTIVGSTANGKYTKFPNGNVVVRGAFLVANVSGNSTGTVRAHVLPLSITEHTASINISNWALSAKLVNTAHSTVGTLSVVVNNAYYLAVSGTVQYVVRGRWK